MDLPSSAAAERASKRRPLEREAVPAAAGFDPGDVTPTTESAPSASAVTDAATVCFRRFVVGFFTSNCGDGGASTAAAGSAPIGGSGSLGVIGGYTHGTIIVGIAPPPVVTCCKLIRNA